MIAKIISSALHGVEAFRITIEVNVSNGTGYFITGQPDDAVKESLSRIDVAFLSHLHLQPKSYQLVSPQSIGTII